MTDGDITEQLSRCYTGVVYDVLRSMGRADCTLPPRLSSNLPAVNLAGPVWTYSGRYDEDLDDHATLLAWTAMLAEAPPDHVIVCQPNDATVAHLGELSAEALKLRGVLGAVIDGGCRDVGFIRKMSFPVFCSYYTPRDIVGNWIPVALGEPVQIGTTTIATGDFLIGDLDGVQLVPRQYAAEVAERALTVVSTESQIRSALLDGMDPQSAYLKYGTF